MSPYGMPKEMGGDSPENDKWMESCVKKVTGKKDKKGRLITKDRAIAICKSSFMKSHGDSAKAEMQIDFFLDLIDNIDLR